MKIITDCPCEIYSKDPNLANNTAYIVVNPAGSGGELPVTGPAIWLTGAAGGLVLALGAAALILGRRRRMRFAA